MDGHFVPNLTIGPPVVKDLRRCSKLFFRVHLMISNPDRLLDDFAAAGADALVVHPETCPHLHRTLSRIRELGLEAGIAVNPDQDPRQLGLPYLKDLIGSITLMSVNPGFPAQQYIDATTRKIADLRLYLTELGRDDMDVEIDGGINQSTAPGAIAAGASTLVAGNAVFGAPDPVAAIAGLRQGTLEPS
jgi:ribulose-phosphate 3-epimerase